MLALGGASVSRAETGYRSGQPSFDCPKARNTVAIILCSGPAAGQADWEYNAALWAYYFSLDDQARERMDERTWQQSLDQMCLLPRVATPSDEAGRQMAKEVGRMLLGVPFNIPGPQPITQGHVNCIVNAYRTRAAMYRSKLTGDALAEATLSPDERADLQQALASKAFLSPDRVGPGGHDGEFGPITRKAIKAFQRSLGASETGFLTAEQRTSLLDTPEKRAAREAQEKAKKDAAEAAAVREAERIAAQEKAKQAAIEATARAKREAELAAESEMARIAAEEVARKAARERAERERQEAEAAAPAQPLQPPKQKDGFSFSAEEILKQCKSNQTWEKLVCLTYVQAIWDSFVMMSLSTLKPRGADPNNMEINIAGICMPVRSKVTSGDLIAYTERFLLTDGFGAQMSKMNAAGTFLAALRSNWPCPKP